MRTTAPLVLGLLLLAAPLLAQGMPQAPAVPTGPPAAQGDDALLQELGLPAEMLPLVRLLENGEDLDPMQMMLLMGLMRGGPGGGMDNDFIPFMLLMNAGKGSRQPTAVVQGDKLYVVDDRSIYVINLATGTVEKTIVYKPKRSLTDLLGAMGPAFDQARERARQEACQSNLKQLCLAVIMYAQDHDETLPDADWANGIQPYTKNAQILICPSRPDLPVGYAFNEALVGFQMGAIARPAETVMLFESDLGGDTPVGGPDALCQQAPHNGGVDLGFADGHVKWVTLDEARDLLAQPVE